MLLYKSGISYINKSCHAVISEGCKKQDFTFSKHTTYGLGGGAEEAYFPRNFAEARAVYDRLKNSCEGHTEKDKITSECSRAFILGNGSNVLAADNKFDGGVLCTKKLSAIFRAGEKSIFCAAGTSVATILKYCINHGLGGLEYLSGIPATIGGIVCMNGGAGGRYINSNVISVKLYDGKNYNLSNEKCNFGYKYSTMRDINALILGVYLSVVTISPKKESELINYYSGRRRSLPKGKSCGCVFKNPSGVPAGKLIEECNLAGFKIGGAYVSPEHCNFIINDGATANDVKKLIQFVADRVFERFAIRLEEEVVYIGDFNETDG